MKPKPWSFSALEAFENCPRQFYETRISKRWQEERSEQILWGEQVHTRFENRQKYGECLPRELETHEPFMEQLDAMSGSKLTEHKIALNNKLKPCGFFDKDVWFRGVIDYGRLEQNSAYLLDYKGLPVNTLISTPGGFITMGDVQVGDLVHSSDGKAYPVTVKSQKHERPCFEVRFDDKTVVTCDNVHLWSLIDGSVVSVTELRPGVSKIPVAAPVEMPAQQLPIDPYVFGLWVADGKHTSAEVSKPDLEVWAEIERRGYTLGTIAPSCQNKCTTRTVKGIRGHLVRLGVLGNKHIPEIYLQGSIDQRLDLLRGLMDGDGSVNPTRQQVVFQSTDRRISNAVKVLIESLGCRVNQAAAKYSGFGVEGTAYPLAWRPRHFNPFLLPRKRDRVGDWGDGRSWYRRVTAVVSVPPQTTQCIGVASPDNTYLCTKHRIVTHNTGKMHAKFKQLKLFALHTFIARPQIREVKVEFYWTQTKSTNGQTYTRDQQNTLWSDFVGPLRQYAEAFQTNTWQPRPSGLCNGWCPVKDCEHWRPKRQK